VFITNNHWQYFVSPIIFTVKILNVDDVAFTALTMLVWHHKRASSMQITCCCIVEGFQKMFEGHGLTHSKCSDLLRLKYVPVLYTILVNVLIG